MASDRDDDDYGGDYRGLTPDHAAWRRMVMREMDGLKKQIEKCVSSEVFEARVGPIQKILWLIFSVVTSGLVMGVLGLLFASGRVGGK